MDTFLLASTIFSSGPLTPKAIMALAVPDTVKRIGDALRGSSSRDRSALRVHRLHGDGIDRRRAVNVERGYAS